MFVTVHIGSGAVKLDASLIMQVNARDIPNSLF